MIMDLINAKIQKRSIKTNNESRNIMLIFYVKKDLIFLIMFVNYSLQQEIIQKWLNIFSETDSIIIFVWIFIIGNCKSVELLNRL